MYQEKIDADFILDTIKGLVESQKVLNPNVWMSAALKLNILLSDEHEKLEDLRSEVAKKKLEIMSKQEKRNVAAADTEIEASEIYKQMRLQEHKTDRIVEFIKLAKKQADSNRF